MYQSATAVATQNASKIAFDGSYRINEAQVAHAQVTGNGNYEVAFVDELFAKHPCAGYKV